MTAKEFKRLYDKHRIATICSKSMTVLSEYMVWANQIDEYDWQYRYFGNSSDRFLQQFPMNKIAAVILKNNQL